jgi:hypothetical protein
MISLEIIELIFLLLATEFSCRSLGSTSSLRTEKLRKRVILWMMVNSMYNYSYI